MQLRQVVGFAGKMSDEVGGRGWGTGGMAFVLLMNYVSLIRI